MICPDCHRTIKPGYRGSCATCLRRELEELRRCLASASRHIAKVNSRVMELASKLDGGDV